MTSPRVDLEGSAREAPHGACDARRAPPDQPVTALLQLHAPQGGQTIEELAQEIAVSRRFLSAEELDARLAHPLADLRPVLAFAAQHGLSLHMPETGLVSLTGPARAMERAFRVDLVEVDSPHGLARIHGALSLPEPVAALTAHVTGLGFGPARSRVSLARVLPAELHDPEKTWFPAEIASWYDASPDLLGQGQCVGVLESLGGYLSADLDAFFARQAMARPEIVDVGVNARADGAYGWANDEVTLDVEIVASAAPRARTAVYFNDPSRYEPFSAASFVYLLNRALHDKRNRPSVLSLSAGSAELADLFWTRMDVEAVHRALAKAVILGVTVCVASGDSGACYPVRQGMFSAPALVYFPSSSPWALCCGGTSARVGEDGKLNDEVVWNRLATRMLASLGGPPSLENLGASTGGVSQFFPRPAWQDGAGVPAWDLWRLDDFQFTGLTTFPGRGCPDVALSADLLTGYKVYIDGAWRNGGGTSASAPLMAALVARMNEGLGTRLGFANALFYDLQIDQKLEVFRTITRGNNGGYSAEPGQPWNPCAGLGAPRVQRLLDALKARLAAPPVDPQGRPAT